MPEPFLVLLIVVVMNDGLAAIAVRIFLLDHSRPVTRLALFDNRGTITVTIAVMIVRLADRYASSDRPNANTDIIGKGRCGNGANHGSNK
jgi:hypothetical protein